MTPLPGAARRAPGRRRRVAVLGARAIGGALAPAMRDLRIEGWHHVPRTGPVLPRGARLPRLRAPVRCPFGALPRLEAAGPPCTRRTVAAAGEELAGVLRAHLAAVTTRTAAATLPQPGAQPRPREE
jgi:hypothetical protein